MAALITLVPTAFNHFAAWPAPPSFCGMMVRQLLRVVTMVPETKGVPLEEIQKNLGID